MANLRKPLSKSKFILSYTKLGKLFENVLLKLQQLVKALNISNNITGKKVMEKRFYEYPFYTFFFFVE